MHDNGNLDIKQRFRAQKLFFVSEKQIANIISKTKSIYSEFIAYGVPIYFTNRITNKDQLLFGTFIYHTFS